MERVKFRTTSTTKGIIKDVFCREAESIYKGKELFSISMDDSELIVKSHIDGKIKKIYVAIGVEIKDTDVLCDLLTEEEAHQQRTSGLDAKNQQINTVTPEFDINNLRDDEYINGDDEQFVDELLREASISNQKFAHDSSHKIIAKNSNQTNQQLSEEDLTVLMERLLEPLRGEFSSLLKYNKDLSDKLDQLNNNDFGFIKNEIDLINQKLNRLPQKNQNNVEKRLTDMEANLNSEIKKIADRYNSLNSQITKSRNKYDELNAKVEDNILNSADVLENTNLFEKIKALTEKLSSLKTKVSFIEDNIDNKISNYDDANLVAKIKKLSDTVMNIKANRDFSDDDTFNAKFDENIEALKNSHKVLRDTFDTKLNLIKNDVEQIGSRLATIEKENPKHLTSSHREITEISRAIEKLSLAFANLNSENRELKKQFDNFKGLESKINKLEENIKKFKNFESSNKLDEKIIAINNKLLSEVKKNDVFLQKISAIEAQIKASSNTTMADKLAEKLAGLDAKLKQEKEKNLSIKKEITELKKIITKSTKSPTTLAKEKTIINEERQIEISKFDMEYSLANLVQFYEENAFYINTLDSPIRIDFIFYKAIQQAINKTNLVKINNLTIPKFSSQKNDAIVYKAVSFTDKSLDEIYEHQDKVAKRTDKIGKVAITDRKFYNKIWDIFYTSNTAEILVIFNSIENKSNSDKKSSLPVNFYVKESINSEKMSKFLLELDKLISQPQLIDSY